MSYKNILVLGMQWGDEGKGKIIDWLASTADAVVRFQGGNNAGHTLSVQSRSLVLRLIPSGILHDSVQCYIGNGVVVSPDGLAQEIQALTAQGIPVAERLRVSQQASVLLPYHVALDQAREKASQSAIGTTGKGIGPAYEDKVARRGLRLAEACDESLLKEKILELSEYHNFLLTRYYGVEALDPNQVFDTLLTTLSNIKPLLVDVTERLIQHQDQGHTILFEGAQGTLLDIDHGTYPFVTSSNTTIGSVASGAGFPPNQLEQVMGISKAYTTRVGNGPFPTELSDEEGALLAKRGVEFGSVTGRARRCGWLDVVLLKRQVAINGVSCLCLTKLDVLDQFETIRVAVAYKWKGKTLTTPPTDLKSLQACQPVYESFPGWRQSLRGLQRYEDLPSRAKQFVSRLETWLEVPIVMLSTGPGREDLIVVKHPCLA